MSDLKTKIARGEYEIDSREVAGEIISKMRTVKRVRSKLIERRASRTTGRSDHVSEWSPDRRRAAF